MDVRFNPLGMTRAAAQGAPPAARETAPAGPLDRVDVSSAPPAGGLLDRVGFGFVTANAQIAGTALAPSSISGPAAAATHAANVSLLEGLQRKGVGLFRRRRLVFKWFRPVDAEKAVKILEKRDKGGDPAKGPIFLNLGSEMGVPLTSSADLRLLDALEGSGNPSGVADEPLARAIHELGRSGFKFNSAQVDARWVVRRGQTDRWSTSREVGTVGAYKILADKLEGFGPITVVGRESQAVASREAMLALNFFRNNGAPSGLADADWAAGMRLVDARYRVSAGGADMLSAYLTQIEKPQDERSVRVRVADDYAISVKRSDIVDGHRLLDTLDQLKGRYDRMSAADRHAAGQVLDRLREAGQADDDHEKAFLTLAGLGVGREVYGTVMGATLPGESATHAAEAFGELFRAAFPKRADMAADAFHFLRTRFDDLRGSVADDVKAARFVKMVGLFETSKEAAGAWDALAAGTAADDAFEAGCQAVQKLKLGRSATEGLQLYQTVRAAVATGDDVGEAVEVMARVGRAVDRSWRGSEGVTSAFGMAWTELRGRGPADMPLDGRRQRFLSLLDRFRDERVATKAWTLLEGARDSAAFDDGVQALDRLRGGLERSADLLGVFTSLEARTRDQGGFAGPEGQRWLHLIEATGSWKGAQEAADMLDRLPQEVPADARLSLFQALAQANGKDLSRVADDLAFLQRFAETAAAMPAAGERYGRLLAAAGGRTREARQTMAMCDGYLSQDGPSGLSAAQRQTLHGRLLSVGLDNGGAHVFLRGLEACAHDEGTAEKAVASLETIRKTYGQQHGRAALSDAIAAWEAIAARTDVAAERASTYAALAEAVAAAGLSPAFVTEQVMALPTLDGMREGCGQLVELSRLGKDLPAVWPSMRPVVERTGWEPALAGVRAFGADARGVQTVFQALAKSTDCDGDLPTAMRWAGVIGKRLGVEVGLGTYRTVRQWADGLTWNGGTEARVERWCEAASQSTRLDGMKEALEVLAVPNGREALEVRERALQALVEALPDGNGRWATAAATYGAVAAGALRGDDLEANAKQAGALLELGLSADQAAHVYRRLQNDRAAGGRFEQQPLADLVRSFGEQYATSHASESDRAAAERLFRGQRRDASANAVEAALDKMHGATGRIAETIQHDESGVMIGGIRVSKRS